MRSIDDLYAALKANIESYARTRRDAVDRGAETPVFAGLLTQKYGQGLAAALKIAADLEDHPAPDLTADVDILVSQIDPYWQSNFTLRINALPADVKFNPAMPAA